MKNQYAVIGLMVVLLTLLLVTPGTHAAEVSVGGGIGFAPDHEGSDYYEPVPVPYFNVNYNHGMFVKLLGLNLRANLIPEKTWNLGPVYNYRPQRDNVDNSRVDRMRDVSDAHELGAFGGFTIKNWFVSLEFLTDLGEAHGGWYSKLKGGYNWIISNSWALSIGASTTYADEDYMQTYFGVTAADAARSGLNQYEAHSGIKNIAIDFGLNWMITRNWRARGLASYAQLVGDADDSSPVVNEGSESQFFGAALIVYTF
jgi:outer membrane scaffolding protein for murein synthesis (MipA/OmpV family)